MVEKIFKRLDDAINHLDIEDYTKLFPLILDDLEYILIEFHNEENKLAPYDEYEYGAEFTEKIIKYFAKLAKLYFKKIYNLEIDICEKNEYDYAACNGAYNHNDNKIYFSSFGLMIGTESDLSFLHTFMHETRHHIQSTCYKEVNPLHFPPSMLIILRDHIFDNSKNENNRQFYQDNYDMFYFENDAEYFALKEVKNFINNLTSLYLKLNPNIDKSMIKRINKLNNQIQKILKKEKFRIDENIIMQIKREEPINGYFTIKDKEIDRLIATDLYIKNNPQLQEKYPILRLLFNGNQVKSYEEIINDKNMYLNNCKNLRERNQIEELYSEIILLDPILTITHYLENNNLKELVEYYDIHPTINEHYSKEIDELKNKYSNFPASLKKN